MEQEDEIIILKDNDKEIIEDDIKFVDKENIYCGDKKRLPEGYDKFGTRRQCLSKGYGSAFYNGDIKSMKKARKKSKKTIKILSKSEVIKLAKRMNIEYKNKDRLEILKNVIDIFNKMKNNIKNDNEE
jgi:hypothetical protein